MNEANDSKFATRKWGIVNDNSKTNYGVKNYEITYDIEVLKPSFYDYNDPYILVRGDISFVGRGITQVAFKNCVLFTKCITKTDGTTIDDAENLDLIMPMYNLIEYSSNYFETTGNLWFYFKDEATNFNANIANNKISKSFKYKAKLLENTAADGTN